jgi:hypothetical protein
MIVTYLMDTIPTKVKPVLDVEVTPFILFVIASSVVKAVFQFQVSVQSFLSFLLVRCL